MLEGQTWKTEDCSAVTKREAEYEIIFRFWTRWSNRAGGTLLAAFTSLWLPHKWKHVWFAVLYRKFSCASGCSQTFSLDCHLQPLKYNVGLSRRGFNPSIWSHLPRGKAVVILPALTKAVHNDECRWRTSVADNPGSVMWTPPRICTLSESPSLIIV